MHHTKEKADLGLAKVIADLVSKGCTPCLPLSEHKPYDLIAELMDGSLVKIQVKYSALKKNGVISVKCVTSWADKHGIHTRHYKKGDFDYYAVYCPERDVVMYVPNSSDSPRSLRFEKTANNQNKYVKWANTYLDIKRESSETIRCTPENGEDIVQTTTPEVEASERLK